jgi:cell division septum initiation protein DivIVA
MPKSQFLSPRVVVPAFLVFVLLGLAIVMVIQGGTRTGIPGPSSSAGSEVARPTPGGAASASGSSPLLWLVGTLAFAALAVGAYWHLNSKLTLARRERAAALGDSTDLRERIEHVLTEKSQLQAEIARKDEDINAHKAAAQAARAAAQAARSGPPRPAPRPQTSPTPGLAGAGHGLLNGTPTPRIEGADPATPKAASTPASAERAAIETLREEIKAQKALRAAESARQEQALREKDEEIGNLVHRWREAESARFEEQETLRREHEAALARVRADAQRGLEQALAQAARRTQELEADCAALRQSADAHLAKVWPRAFTKASLDGLRRAIAQGVEAEPPVPEALALFGIIHQFSASAGTTRSGDLAFEVGRAFYSWREGAGAADPAWEEQLADWLNELLKESRLRVVVVKPGDAISARLHSPEGAGPQVRRPLSFLVLREDGTPFKRALVAT